LYKNPPYESESDDSVESSEEESLISSDSSEPDDDDFTNDPYYAKVDINDSNRALYAGAGVMWGYQPNKPKFIPYDPVRRAELQQREQRKREREERLAAKQALREEKVRRKAAKDGLFGSDSEEEEEEEEEKEEEEEGGEDDASGVLSRLGSGSASPANSLGSRSQSRGRLGESSD